MLQCSDIYHSAARRLPHEGMVFDIQRFCLSDGPGVRTTVFLKGCPLRCLWCHNPESQSFDAETLFDSSRCLGCGDCVKGCPTEARRVVGKCMSVDEVMIPVLSDQGFYASDGGLTLSGGEPLAQPDFTAALLQRAKDEGIHTAIETSLYAPEAVVNNLLPLVDLWLVDAKAAAADHLSLTGGERAVIDHNRQILKPGTFILQIPVLSVNFTPAFEQEIPQLAQGATAVELLPGHNLGDSKYQQLGKKNSTDWTPQENLTAIRERLIQHLTIPVYTTLNLKPGK